MLWAFGFGMIFMFFFMRWNIKKFNRTDSYEKMTFDRGIKILRDIERGDTILHSNKSLTDFYEAIRTIVEG